MGQMITEGRRGSGYGRPTIIGRVFASVLSASLLVGAGIALARGEALPDGWSTASPRDEIRPAFSYDPSGGPNRKGALVIRTDQREGLQGRWLRTFPVYGGKHYRFSALRRAKHVESPRRAAVARVTWTDDQGRQVSRDEPSPASYQPGEVPRSEPEYPTDGAEVAPGWVEVAATYRVPARATRALVELEMRWAPDATLEWSEVALAEVAAPKPRTVRLATVHFQPKGGKTPADKCRLFAPLIAEAAKQKADLVVLPETLTYYGTGMSFSECAEPVPGPSTAYFGELARQHNLYVVAGLLERDRHLIYNVAVLLGPDGKIVGKYRKVCLPRGEIEGGITPGTDYPVFATRFGKVGMMVCYDGFFPEVARELSNRGAEVIAWPVWGCNPLLGAARACENHVYVVSSTYTDVSSKWMISAVYAQDGQTLVQAKEWGTVALAEVDLDRKLYWSSLGDFKAEVTRHRPLPPDAAKAGK
jgi:predicted amidohydrolase